MTEEQFEGLSEQEKARRLSEGIINSDNTVTLKQYAYVNPGNRHWASNGLGNFMLSSSDDMEDCGYVYVAELEVTFEIPKGFDLTAASVRMLCQAKEAVRKEYDTKLANIEEQIQNLLCLPAPTESGFHAAANGTFSDDIPF